MTRECVVKGCSNQTMFCKCNEHKRTYQLNRSSEQVKRKREEILEDKKDFEAKYGWLANLISSFILGIFKLAETLLKTIFRLLLKIGF